MINLPLDELLEKVDSRYTLVSVIAARAGDRGTPRKLLRRRGQARDGGGF